MPEEFTLSFAAVDIVLEDLKLGIAPPPFKVPRAARTFDERAHVRGEVWDEELFAGNIWRARCKARSRWSASEYGIW